MHQAAEGKRIVCESLSLYEMLLPSSIAGVTPSSARSEIGCWSKRIFSATGTTA
jgi:hypothetical protein